ncbi:MAG: acyltransferase [Cellvibrionaceae bacterium]
MRLLKRIIGIVIYLLTRNVSFRYILPERYSSFIERIRTYALVLQGAKIGKSSYLRSGGFVAYPKNLVLGENVKVGENSQFYNYDRVFIDDNTEIGSNLYVQTNEHNLTDKTLPLAKQGAYSSPVSIGAGVYVGANVTILSGVHVADRCVIAAGAVVIKDTETGFIYGGIPAKKISEIQ